jgi:integrase
MSKKFDVLTRPNMRKLEPGQRLQEHGIIFERLLNGDGRFIVNIRVDTKRIHRTVGLESEGVTRESAEKFVEQARTDARHERLSLPKGRKTILGFEEASQKYIARLRESDGKDIDKKEQRFRLHLIPYFKTRPLMELSSFELERYKKYRRTKGAMPATINRELAVISHLLNRAVEWEWISHLPGKLKLLKEDNARTIYLTPEQCNRLLETAKNDTNTQIYLFILIGLETAMRKTEILTVQIENIDVQTQTIFIPKAKAGSRVQPITKRLAEFLSKHLAGHGRKEGWLFPSIGNFKSKSGYSTSIEESFRRVVSDAGLDAREITPHVLRHTATTHLVQAGVDLPTVQAITGHKTPSMVYRYSHHNNEHIQQAMDRLQQKYDTGKKKVSPTQERHSPLKTQKSQEAERLSETDFSGEKEWYPQGNSNPRRLREREVS